MKLIYLKSFGILSALAVLFFSCKKEGENMFNKFNDVEVTFTAKSQYAVTDYKEINVGDSVYIEYNFVSSEQDMYAACVFQNGSTSGPFLKTPIPASQRRNYSGVYKFKANIVGKTTFRFWPVDSRGVYLGDGYKTVTVEVRSDFTLYPGRRLYVSGIPDSTTHNFDPYVNEKSYASVTTGETFSYLEGAANSAKIDFGAAISVTYDASTPPKPVILVSLYSLKANPITFPHYDTSRWTDKGTVFSALIANGTTVWKTLKSGALITTAAKAANPTLKLTPNLTTGSMFYFLTKTGVYGAVLVNSFRIVDRKPMIDIDIKVTK